MDDAGEDFTEPGETPHVRFRTTWLVASRTLRLGARGCFQILGVDVVNVACDPPDSSRSVSQGFLDSEKIFHR